MKPRYFILLLCASLLAAVQAGAKTILPDACGDDSVKFEVILQKGQPAPAPPAADKAQIVFSESGAGVARVGMDGAWLGANEGDSYFVVTVDPGIHHLCASWEISGLAGGRAKQESVKLATITVEAGKIYYIESSAGATGGGGGGTAFVPPTMGANGAMSGGGFVHTQGGGGTPYFNFVQLDEDTGHYRVKAWKVAISTPYQ